jgi:hypothetical protein
MYHLKRGLLVVGFLITVVDKISSVNTTTGKKALVSPSKTLEFVCRLTV